MGTVTCKLEDGVALVALDDGKANAINPTFLSGLDGAIDQATEQRAPVVLVGRPGLFCGGLDLKVLPALEPPELMEALRRFGEVMLRLFTYDRPVVAACTGHAIAGGMVLALCADERWVADGPYKIGLNETALGLTLPSFIVEMARTQIPASSLAKVIVQGELFDPAGAERVGLVDGVRPAEEVIELAKKRAQLLGFLPAKTYGDNKRGVRGDAADRGRAAYAAELAEFSGAIGGKTL